MLEKLIPKVVDLQEQKKQGRKKEEGWLLKNTRVIILAFSEYTDLSGRKIKTLKRWDLGKVAKTVVFFVGEEASVMVEAILLHLPHPGEKNQKNDSEEWQANDFFPVPVPRDEDLLFRDYRMLMRLDASSPSLPFSSTGIVPMAQFPWVEGVKVTVPYLDIIRQATYSEWRRLLIAAK